MDFYTGLATMFFVIAGICSLGVLAVYVSNVAACARERRARRAYALARCMSVHPAGRAKL